jgi:N-acetylmuramoyl-L-alanine amidase
MSFYTVRKGDCISSIADYYGLFWEKIWNDPNNSELKEKRKDPNVLYPGDVVFIPEKEIKEYSCATDKKHRFHRKGIPLYLRLQMLDEDDKPIANVSYTLDIDGGETIEGKTGPDGKIEQAIPPGARSGTLHVEGDDPVPLSFGELDPIDTAIGVKQRLMNLGYDCGDEDGETDEEAQEVLREFQEKYGLNPTGEVDQATKDKLLEVHGS